MKIKNKILLSVDESDLKNGVFANKKITEISSGCFVNMPMLIRVNVPNVTTVGNYSFSSNNAFTEFKIGNKTLVAKDVDGHCFVIESIKTSKGIRLYLGYNFLGIKNKIINKQACWVAEKGGFCAHGVTAKKAVSDLQFKIVTDKLQKDPINADTKFTVKYYRLLTGACDLGARSWLDANNIPYDIIGNG